MTEHDVNEIDVSPLLTDIEALAEQAAHVPDDGATALQVAEAVRAVARAVIDLPAVSPDDVPSDVVAFRSADSALIGFPDGSIRITIRGGQIAATALSLADAQWEITFLESDEPTRDIEPAADAPPRSIVAIPTGGRTHWWSFDDAGSSTDMFDPVVEAEQLEGQRRAWLDLGATRDFPDPPELSEKSIPESLAETAPESLAETAPESLAETAPESSAEPAPEPLAEPAPESLAEPAPEPGPGGQAATHRVAASGTTVGAVAAGTPPSLDLAGTAVKHIQRSTSGWALVECPNGARCWVDPADLEPLVQHASAARPVPVASRVRWCYVEGAVPLQASDGGVIGHLVPGRWYAMQSASGGWALVRDDNGREGWVPANSVHPHQAS